MRLALALCLAAAPALAQETPVPPTADEDGFSLVEEGVKLMLRGMLTEMEPALQDMEQALQGMEPALRDLGPKFASLVAMIDDFRNYDAPVMLENGDILIRRTAPLPAKPLLDPLGDPIPGPNGEIDL